MDYVRLGKTNILVSRVAFGAMRLSDVQNVDSAGDLVRKAYDAGVNFFDTSRKTPESEKLLGDALYDIRRNVFLSTATSSKTSSEITEDLETSLMTLHCDTVDLFQLEVEKFLPLPDGADNIYETLLNFKKSGKIKSFGIITTNLETAKKVAESGLYDTLQFPFSMVSAESSKEIVELCEEHDVGFIAMQPLGGGLIDNIPLALGYLSQFENVVPIWGVVKQEELDQILYFNAHPPVIDEQFHKDVEKVRNFFN